MSHGVLYADPTNKPLSPLTSLAQLLPFAYYLFYLTGGTFPIGVFQDGDRNIPFPSNKVTADASGTFPAIFLPPDGVFRVQMFDQYNRKLIDVDPYICSITSFGTSQLSINTLTGNVSISPNAPGGAGASLTVTAKKSGIALDTGAAGFTPNQAEVQLLNTGITGNTLGTFSGDNKPGGVVNGGVAQWMPINVNGALFYIPLWI